MKPVRLTWIEGLDEDEIREALEEAITDAYGDEEQHLGLTNMTMESLEFPFSAKVMGETVEVLDAAIPKYDSRGLDLIVKHQTKQFAIAASSVELVQPLPEGHLYLAAYLRWRANQ